MALLNSLWKKLSNKQSHTLPNVDAIPSRLTPSMSVANIGNDPSLTQDIYLPLRQLYQQRQIIEVKLKDSSLSYQTLIMAIDEARGLLWLDNLFPAPHLLEVGDQITVRHHRYDEQLCFSTPLLAWGDEFGVQGFAIMLPDYVAYAPRRQYRRASLNQSANLTAKIRPIGQDISYGSVQDISAGGLRLSVTGNLLGQLRHGALLPLCELRLSEELLIRCSARVRAFKLSRSPSRNTHISIEFVDLAKDSQLHLAQFVNNIAHFQQSHASAAQQFA